MAQEKKYLLLYFRWAQPSIWMVAIYQGVCAIFIASCYGIHLTLPQMMTIILTATLASIGTAGVPGSGMVMLAMVLTSVGLPVDGIALVAGVDRIFDMGRTTVNITGDASCCIIVSNLERKKEQRRVKKRRHRIKQMTDLSYFLDKNVEV